MAQNCQGRSNNLAAKVRTSRHKGKDSQQKKKLHEKKEKLKEKDSRQKKKPHGERENLTAKSKRGTPIAFFNPTIPTKIFSQSLNPDGLYWPIPIPMIQFCLSPFPKLRRAFSVGDDFLNQHWSVEVYGHRKEYHHHHTGNRTSIFHLPLRLVSRCFLAAPRSQSVRGWLVRSAKFLSGRGTTGEFQLLPLLFPVWQSADPLLQQMFTLSHSPSVCSVLSPVEMVTVELLVWPTGSRHIQVQDTKNLDL